MRVLLIKTSSLGDVIHTLPALTDAARAIPGIRFDWVVEESFAEIPSWHPAVDRVIPVAVRRWRKSLARAWLSGEWRRFTRSLVEKRYDATIDAQGLLKSAILSRYATVPVHGLDKHSAREPLAARFYTDRHTVAWGRHATERVRELFAKALGYPVPTTPLDYGLDRSRLPAHAEAPSDRTVPAGSTINPAADAPATVRGELVDTIHQRGPSPGSGRTRFEGQVNGATAQAVSGDYLVFLHGTTWATKHWPERYWRQLAERADAAGWPVRLPWGNEAERLRAERIATGLATITVLPKLSLSGLAAELAQARACVAVDTGLGHLAAALAVPTISLYGPTNPALTGAWGPGQTHLASDFPCAPCLKKTCGYQPTQDDRSRFDVVAESPLCFTRLSPDVVWKKLEPALSMEVFAS